MIFTNYISTIVLVTAIYDPRVVRYEAHLVILIGCIPYHLYFLSEEPSGSLPEHPIEFHQTCELR
jgi:hypothetical protein